MNLSVSNQPLKIQKDLKKYNLKFIDGLEMAKYQLIKQFSIYTKLNINKNLVDKILYKKYFI